MKQFQKLLPLLALLIAAFAPQALAAGEMIIISPSDSTMSIVFASPMGATGRAPDLASAVNRNLELVPFLKIIDPRGIVGGASVASPSGKELDFSKFRQANAQLLVTTNWPDAGHVEMRVFEPLTGKFVFGNRYEVKPGDVGVYDVADKFSADLLESIIGRGDFFRATLAFAKKDGPKKQDIWTVRPNGRSLRKLTNLPGQALSPTWSKDGRFVLFSHVDSRSHALGVWDSSKQTLQRIRFPGNTVIGPSFMPDNKVAVGLTDGRNPSIFLLNHIFQKERKLETSGGIDVSPSVDASGTKMVFTSDRLGNPQIFLKDLRTGSVRRISKTGGYNTDPSISPDGTLVAFARQMGGGHRIFVHDLRTGRETQVTFGPGSDEQPEFAPDSYFIAFTSTRSGEKSVYLTTRHGGEARRVETGPGDASFPAWGLKN